MYMYITGRDGVLPTAVPAYRDRRTYIMTAAATAWAAC